MEGYFEGRIFLSGEGFEDKVKGFARAENRSQRNNGADWVKFCNRRESESENRRLHRGVKIRTRGKKEDSSSNQQTDKEERAFVRSTIKSSVEKCVSAR